MTDVCAPADPNCIKLNDVVFWPKVHRPSVGLPASGPSGRLRLNSPVGPVKGDLLIEPQDRLRVQKLVGSVVRHKL